MKIVVARIDERLIHGQIAYSWSVAYQVTQILVIDDVVAKDQTQIMLLGMAVPSGKKHAILSVEDGVKYIREQSESERILLVVKNPNVLLSLLEEGIELPAINVGGMYYKSNKKEISKTVYVDEKDIETFLEIKDKDIPCEIRTSPNDRPIDLYSKI